MLHLGHAGEPYDGVTKHTDPSRLTPLCRNSKDPKASVSKTIYPSRRDAYASRRDFYPPSLGFYASSLDLEP